MSIRYIEPPQNWRIVKEVGVHKQSNKHIITVAIGSIDDYYEDDLIVWMLKEHYTKCVSGQYQVTRSPYSEKSLTLKDAQGNEIEPEQISESTFIY